MSSIDDPTPTTPSRRRRALGAVQRVADRVLSVNGAATVSCFVGGAALDALAPGLSKALDPHLLQSTVHHSFHQAVARLEARRGRPIPSIGALAARLDKRKRADTSSTIEVDEDLAHEAEATAAPRVPRHHR